MPASPASQPAGDEHLIVVEDTDPEIEHRLEDAFKFQPALTDPFRSP